MVASTKPQRKMRERRRRSRIDLHRPELEPPGKSRGVVTDVLLGVIAWLATIALTLAIWRWIAGLSTLAS